MHKAIKRNTGSLALLNTMLILSLAACSSIKGASPTKPDPQKVQQASIMTNKCLLNHHDIPGSLSKRQECLNQASAMLMDGYGPEIQNVARMCAQKLIQLAAAGDAGQIDLKGYQQKREMLKIECAQAAQSAQR